MSPKSKTAQPNTELKEDDEAYRLKRDRNNMAVKKSRAKSRQKAQETSEKITQLREENSDLEHQVDNLTNELNRLKKTLLAHVGGRRNPQHADTALQHPTSALTAESKLALADPQTVNRDHEYVGQKSTLKSELTL